MQIQLINATELSVEIILVSREEDYYPALLDGIKVFTLLRQNLLPKSVVKMKHLTREQSYRISLMPQEGKSRKDIAIGVNTSAISRELRKICDLRNGSHCTA